MAESKRDYYEVLGIGKMTDDVAIRKVYYALTKEYHPDASPGDAEAEKKFKEASKAYTVLSDPEKRRQYDQFGHAAFDGGAGGGGYGGFDGFDFNGTDIGGIFGGIFGDIFGGGGSSRGARYNGPMHGVNVRTSIHVSPEETIFGCEKEAGIDCKDECASYHGTGAKAGTKPETCPKCNGKGKIMYTQQSMFGQVQNVQACPDCEGSGQIIKGKCPDCHGAEYITRRKKLRVTIPADINDGQNIRMAGAGEPGANGGGRGGLLVEAVVSKHPVLIRKDTNIYSAVPVPLATATLGDPARVNTVDGQIEHEMKSGTQTDTKVRLKGKGVPSLHSKAARDGRCVTLVVQVPERMNGEQKEALRRFDEMMAGKITKSGKDEGEESGNHKKRGFFR